MPRQAHHRKVASREEGCCRDRSKVLFIIFAVLAVAGGLGTITRRNIVHALLLLVFTFLNVAAIFFLTQAYFLAVVQILVYAGAIMVLFVFVIMLLNLRTFERGGADPSRAALDRPGALGAGAGRVRRACWPASPSPRPRAASRPRPSPPPAAAPRSSATSSSTTMLLPFEVASVVLLVAMVGAIILVKKEKSGGEATRAWEPGEQPSADVAEEEV